MKGQKIVQTQLKNQFLLSHYPPVLRMTSWSLRFLRSYGQKVDEGAMVSILRKLLESNMHETHKMNRLLTSADADV